MQLVPVEMLLLYAHQAGLDLETVMQSVASGAAGSWSLSNLGPRIIANQFGLRAALVVAGILSMGFMGFAGLGR